MWSAVGLGISLVVALAAAAGAVRAGGHYDAEVYGMTPAVHRRYGVAAAILALIFGYGLVAPLPIVVPLLGVAVLLALFYLTSFLRGAEADD